MTRARSGFYWLPLSLFIAVLLGLLPLPEMFAALRPYFLGMVAVYWLLEMPDRFGMGAAFATGLVGDLVFGTLIGEQALRLTVLAFIVQRFRARLRFFPIGQQSAAVFALLLNDRVIAAAVRSALGEGVPRWPFWLSPLLVLLLWPWMVLSFDVLRARSRERRP
ncbi:MAG: rod shape-determining protein MreD [Lysobacteraceae bacterium]